MTTLEPRPAYSSEELAALYPKSLFLRQVQVVLRHGERTPVSTRLNVPPYWPYCHAATRFSAAVFAAGGGWDHLPFKRQMETFGPDGEAVIARGPKGESNGICLLGELTDKGRETTLSLGQRLRQLYIDQLGFLDSQLTSTSHLYLRATPIVRALESLQEVYTGMFPPDSRISGLPPPTIVSRMISDENLFPNDANCRRFLQLSRAFADLAAYHWNESDDMNFLRKKLGSHVDRVAVNGKPRLSGIMDSINSTLAHGPEVRLPKVFYEKEVREKIERINVDEWFRGYEESSEYRRLGVGSLLGDIRDRFVQAAGNKERVEGGERKDPLKLALMGCHDTTLGGLLASLGAFDHRWPPYTSHIAFELFSSSPEDKSILPIPTKPPSVFTKFFGFGKNGAASAAEKDADVNMDGWYVRLRYNDAPLTLKGCQKEGNHLEGDKTFCTLAAFSEIAMKMRPKNWKTECAIRLDEPGVPVVELVE